MAPMAYPEMSNHPRPHFFLSGYVPVKVPISSMYYVHIVRA